MPRLARSGIVHMQLSIGEEDVAWMDVFLTLQLECISYAAICFCTQTCMCAYVRSYAHLTEDGSMSREGREN